MIPLVGGLIVFVANIWMLVAMVVAVRQALDYQSTGRAVGVCEEGQESSHIELNRLTPEPANIDMLFLVCPSPRA